MTTEDWTHPGAHGETIYGTTHAPIGPARGVVLIAHGFKGYKDYGMFPCLAATLAAAGLIAHRFNFSHSGMTPNVATFERPDLFERDTWNRQVEDLRALLLALDAGVLAGGDAPRVLLGHSRGGVSVLLAAGRPPVPTLAGVVTLAAPSRCLTISEDDQRRLLTDGAIESPSSRTGQTLRVGKSFLEEQREDPGDHDLLALVKNIACPVLVIHGADDTTVPAACAAEIADAVGAEARSVSVAGGDHVFCTPNPMPADAAPGPELRVVLDEAVAFCCRAVER